MPTANPTIAPHGTQEWAKSNVNIQTGCENDCRYCYAKCMAIRFKRATPDSWSMPILNPASVSKGYRRRTGRIMFPTSHDITDCNVDSSLAVLTKMLQAGNDVLIVSKPRISVTERLTAELAPYQDQITFRFSIGSASSETLRFWEPGAPDFSQRLRSLMLAFEAGFQTSVSCEPMLDREIDLVVSAVRPYVTDTIWLGKANRLRSIIPLSCPNDNMVAAAAEKLIAWQSDDAILALYERFKDDSQIKWKDSIKKVVGLDRPNETGLDI